MSVIVAIIGAILAIFLIILLHEMGHFFVARWFGIKILRFSIGFGKALYKRRGKSGTEYVLAAIPLGGYVKMLGDGGGEAIPEHEKSAAYSNKPLWVRMLVVLAGALTNFILAFFVFWIAFMIGSEHLRPIVGHIVPDSFAAKAGVESGDEIISVSGRDTKNWQQVAMAMVAEMGNDKVAVLVKPWQSSETQVRQFDLTQWKIKRADPKLFELLGMLPDLPKTPPVIKRVVPKSPAAKAGLAPYEEILAVDGDHVTYWEEMAAELAKRPNQSVVLTLKSERGVWKTTAQLENHDGKGYLGVIPFPLQIPPEFLYVERYTPLTAVVPAAQKTRLMFEYNAIFLGKLLTAKLSIHTVGGPISIFQAAGQATHAGWQVYLSFIGFISVTVGFINLLPIPGLDGGHLLFQLIEAVIRRPVSLKIQQYGFLVGILLIAFIVVQATINDLRRLFGG